MWVFSGDDHTVLIDYIVDGEHVIPTSASVTVRDHVGNPLISNSVLDVTSTQVSFEVSGANNTLVGSNVVESRFLNVYFLYEGRQYRRDLSYRITEFVPLSVTAEDVRSEIGVDQSELADHEVDLLRAYHQLVTDYGSAFSDSLTVGTSLFMEANEAVVLRAAINLIPSLNLRVGVQISAEENKFQRMSEFDPDHIQNVLASRLAAIMDLITGEDATTVDPLTLVTPTDVITGA